MMIKKNILSLFIILNSFIFFGQENNKETGFYDNDDIEDLIYYKFNNNEVDGPFYEFKIISGNGKEYNFDLGVSFKYISLFNSKKGEIQITQNKDGIQGFEETSTYIYSELYDTWILVNTETLYQDDGKKEIYRPKVPTSIDGTEYMNETIDYEGVYELKSCENSRFKIKIYKKGENYLFCISDKNKKISNGNLILKKDKENNLLLLNEINAEYKDGNLVVLNYKIKTNKSLHFTQCNEEYLTFLKKD